MVCFSLVLNESNVCFRPSQHGNLQCDALGQNIESGATQPFVPGLVLQSLLLFHSSFNSVFVILPGLFRLLDFVMLSQYPSFTLKNLLQTFLLSVSNCGVFVTLQTAILV